MKIYEVEAKYAQAFADFVPESVLKRIGMPGYSSLGGFSQVGEDYYATGFLQYYKGRRFTDRVARLTYLYVPEEERREANAWSLLKEMHRRLKASGVSGVELLLCGAQIDDMKPFFMRMGFVDAKNAVPTVRLMLSEVFTDKILSSPGVKKAVSLEGVPAKEVRRILKVCQGDKWIDTNDYTERLSFMYKDAQTEGLLLARVVPEGGVELICCRCIGENTAKQQLSMVAAAGQTMRRYFDPDTPILIPCNNDQTEKGIRVVNPDASPEAVWRGEIEYGK